MKILRNLLVIAILTVLLTFSGCATLLAPTTQPLSLSTDVENVEVFINGKYVGVAPTVVNLTADKEYVIQFKKNGYHTVTSVVTPKIGLGWVVVDLIGGFVPVIIDAITRRWMVLDKKSINVYLRSEES
jgi:hypothetical protein